MQSLRVVSATLVLPDRLIPDGAIEIEMTVKKPGPEPEPAESATRLNLENVAEGSMAPYTSWLGNCAFENRATRVTVKSAVFPSFRVTLTRSPCCSRPRR